MKKEPNPCFHSDGKKPPRVKHPLVIKKLDKMEYVYKFQPISCNTIDALKNSYLYFPTPSQLDDPFDCLFAFDLGGNEIDNLPFRSDAHDIGEGVKFARERVGVLSLSKINDHILLWSQYSDGHKGICLKFKTHYHNEKPYFAFEQSHFSDDKSEGAYILPIHEVTYDISLPTPIKLGNIRDFERFLLTKHKDWSFQEEIRIATDFNTLNGNQKVKYRKDYLDSIIFGMKTSPEDVQLIKEIVGEHFTSKGDKIKYYKAQQIKGKYAIEINTTS